MNSYPLFSSLLTTFVFEHCIHCVLRTQAPSDQAYGTDSWCACVDNNAIRDQLCMFTRASNDGRGEGEEGHMIHTREDITASVTARTTSNGGGRHNRGGRGSWWAITHSHPAK